MVEQTEDLYLPPKRRETQGFPKHYPLEWDPKAFPGQPGYIIFSAYLDLPSGPPNDRTRLENLQQHPVGILNRCCNHLSCLLLMQNEPKFDLGGQIAGKSKEITWSHLSVRLPPAGIDIWFKAQGQAAGWVRGQISSKNLIKDEISGYFKKDSFNSNYNSVP